MYGRECEGCLATELVLYLSRFLLLLLSLLFGKFTVSHTIVTVWCRFGDSSLKTSDVLSVKEEYTCRTLRPFLSLWTLVFRTGR